jgi:integrase
MSVRRRKDGGWRVDVVIWRGGQRLRVKRSAGEARTRAEALEVERLLRHELADGAPVQRVQRRFEAFAIQFLETYARTNNRPSEQATKRVIITRHLVPFFGHLELGEIGPLQIEEYKALKLATHAAKTVNNHLCVLRRMFTIALEWSLISKLPKFRWLKTPAPPFTFLGFDESDRLIRAAEGWDGAWRAMVIVALRAGLRLGELRALTWQDVDLVAGRVLVRRSAWQDQIGPTKTGRAREVPLSPEAVAALHALPSRFRQRSVFSADGAGGMLARAACRKAIGRICRKAGLPEIGWHALRHTFASQLVMRGVALKAVQELLGHRTMEMTLRYAHLSPEVGRNAVSMLDTPAKGGKAVTG